MERQGNHCIILPSSSSPLPTSVFFDYVTNYHRLGGLNDTNVFVYYLEARSPKSVSKSSPPSRCQRDHILWSLWEGILALLLPASGSCQHSSGHGRVFPVSASVVPWIPFICPVCQVSLSLCPIRIYVTVCRPYPDNGR